MGRVQKGARRPIERCPCPQHLITLVGRSDSLKVQEIGSAAGAQSANDLSHWRPYRRNFRSINIDPAPKREEWVFSCRSEKRSIQMCEELLQNVPFDVGPTAAE